jgi:hypothetical protein
MKTVSISKILNFAEEYNSYCIIKVAFVKKLPNGMYAIVSRKGKILGKFKTKNEAVERLRQIEYFKNKKEAKKKDVDSYSATMRELNKSYDKDVVLKFQKEYKKLFDERYLAGEENPEDGILPVALECIAEAEFSMVKIGNAIEMGNPIEAGAYLANLIKFLCRRISVEKRQHSINGLKRKIYYLNEFDIASKRTPSSSVLGQSITILKTLLLEHDADYIRKVLNSIVGNL